MLKSKQIGTKKLLAPFYFVWLCFEDRGCFHYVSLIVFACFQHVADEKQLKVIKVERRRDDFALKVVHDCKTIKINEWTRLGNV